MDAFKFEEEELFKYLGKECWNNEFSRGLDEQIHDGQ